MDLPFLSVLTVCRNDCPGLLRTHSSLAAWPVVGVEWLVQDGASTDGTVQALGALTRPIADWRSEPDTGPYDAMNRLLARATGRYVLFLNAGDGFADDETLGRIADVLTEDPPPDLVYGDAWEATPNGWALKRARSHRRLWAGLFTHHQAILYRRALVADLRYPIEYRIAADYAFTLDALARSTIVRRVDWPVCRFAAGGMSQRQARLGRTEQARIRCDRLGLSAPVNALISAAQASSLTLRRALPGLYGCFRYQRR